LLAAFVSTDRSRNADLIQRTMAIAQGRHRRQTGMDDAPLAAQMAELRMRQMRELVNAMQRGSEVC
jgi:hypothetical protein